MKLKLIPVLIVSLIFSHCSSSKVSLNPTPYTIDYSVQQNVRAAHGGVASAHPLASKVGKYILENGGNAVDAAVAVQLALAVVYPAAGNIGGGGFMVIHFSNGINKTLDFREKAPGSATKDMYLDSF